MVRVDVVGKIRESAAIVLQSDAKPESNSFARGFIIFIQGFSTYVKSISNGIFDVVEIQFYSIDKFDKKETKFAQLQVGNIKTLSSV